MAGDVNALMQEGQMYSENRQWDAAIKSFTKVLEIDSYNGEACRYLAIIFALTGRIKQVVDIYYKLMEICAYYGDIDGAISVANDITALEPESDKVRLRVIDLYRAKGDMAEVVQRARELSRLYIEQEHGDLATQMMEVAIESDPDNIDIRRELAEMYLQNGQIDEGVAQYRNVVSLYSDIGDIEKAVEGYNRLKVFVRDDPNIMYSLGRLYVELQRYDEAEKEFRGVLRSGGFDNEDALYALGDICIRRGNYKDAELPFKKIISNNPEAALAIERLAEISQYNNDITNAVNGYLNSARVYEQIGETGVAIVLYQRVLALDEANSTANNKLIELGAPVVAEMGETYIPMKKAGKGIAKSSTAKGTEGGADEGEEGEGHHIRAGLTRKGGVDGPRRAGLASKGGLKSGLSGGGKPALGGKPTLGSEGTSGRPGLVKSGLVSGGKPTLGGGKAVLSRKSKRKAEQEEPKVVSKVETNREIPAEQTDFVAASQAGSNVPELPVLNTVANVVDELLTQAPESSTPVSPLVVERDFSPADFAAEARRQDEARLAEEARLQEEARLAEEARQ
ncbi:MAG: tetratricopeptide repeat protein, partial [bacterium]|nr:tetratricopeptide repeat protein [bacterium]